MFLFQICLICWWFFEYNGSTLHIYGIYSFSKSLLSPQNTYWIYWFDIWHLLLTMSLYAKRAVNFQRHNFKQREGNMLQVTDTLAVKNILPRQRCRREADTSPSLCAQNLFWIDLMIVFFLLALRSSNPNQNVKMVNCSSCQRSRWIPVIQTCTLSMSNLVCIHVFFFFFLNYR